MKAKKSFYFIGRTVQRRRDGLMKYTFYSRHSWPFHKAGVLIKPDEGSFGVPFEVWEHFEEFKTSCRAYRQNQKEKC